MPDSQPSQALRVDPVTGLVLGARQVLSHHFDSRPHGVAPDLIVVHSISLPPGEYGGPWIDHLFTGSLPVDAHPYFAQALAGGRVSTHVLIRRDGQIVQYVPFNERAWHSGRSEFRGRKECNDYSVGIELEGLDDVPYEAAQYASLIALVRALFAAYPGMSPDRIAAHSDVAPGRKTDPGPAFDWARLRSAL